MKFLGYIFLFLFAEFSFAQENNAKEVFTPVETMPEFPGGTMEMMKFIQKKVIYPKEAKEKDIVGQPIIKFVIDSTGAINNAIVRQTSGNLLLDNEALRVISLMPKWKPGTQKGRAVSVFFNLPIRFDIDNKLSSQKKEQAELANKYYNDGVKFFGENNFILAKQNFTKALSLNCYDTDSKYNLGTTYLKLNQKDSACVIWNDLKTSFNPKDKDEAEKLIKKYCTN